MDAVRKPYQGVLNIIRFNWHFYVIALISICGLFVASSFHASHLAYALIASAVAIIISTLLSLSVSYYIYDASGLYNFPWMKDLKHNHHQMILNIHAGFDETSAIIRNTFSDATLEVYDFYDPMKHTEVSIERARKAYPPFPGTTKIATTTLPAPANSISLIFNIFSLHEVRDHQERVDFLKAQVSALSDEGSCIVVEHLRDLVNFAAYNMGFLHFHSESEWSKSFTQAGLVVEKQFNDTPFITVFILKKYHGRTH